MIDHTSINRDYWDGMADNWIAGGERLWAASPQWGIWGAAEEQVQMFRVPLGGADAVELGCGTGYVSGWIAKAGARVEAIDISPKQLGTARRLAQEHRVDISFALGNAEALPYADATFDFAVSEYGAAIWCDPEVWLREAWRVLRSGGMLAFLGNHPLTLACSPLSGEPYERILHRPLKGLRRVDWTEVDYEPGGIEFNRPHGDWFKLFSEVGFQVVDYTEIFAPPHATGMIDVTPAEWAKDFPSEQIWWVRKP